MTQRRAATPLGRLLLACCLSLAAATAAAADPLAADVTAASNATGTSVSTSGVNPSSTPPDSAAMREAREALWASHGAGTTFAFFGERLEHQASGDDRVVWEAQAWYGGDVHKAWLKTEGEYLADDRFEEAELQLLYSRAVHAFWDLQAGLRHDIKPDPSRSYAVIGLHGTAPYWFELDAQLFLSHKGDASARLEAEYDLRLTQCLLLQPRLELNAALSEDAAIEIGAGPSTVKAGLRLRYELSSTVAPYLGFAWQKAFGDTADLTDEDEQRTVVLGVRFWF